MNIFKKLFGKSQKIIDCIDKDKPGTAITEYLSKIGLSHMAYKNFKIKLQLDGQEIVNVKLKGHQTEGRVIDMLKKRNHLAYNKAYMCKDWPQAGECMGGLRHHISACVCELDPDKIYRIESYEIKKMPSFR